MITDRNPFHFFHDFFTSICIVHYFIVYDVNLNVQLEHPLSCFAHVYVSQCLLCD